jgi:hypothetical protein
MFVRVVFSRLALLVCGIAAILTGNAFIRLREFLQHSEWLGLSVILLGAGFLSLVAAVIPDVWIKRLLWASSEQHLSSLPMTLLMIFAASSYLLVVAITFAGPALSIPPLLVYSLCPACVITVTVDPSLPTVLFFLAPLNAAVYGAVGGAVGYLVTAFRRQHP